MQPRHGEHGQTLESFALVLLWRSKKGLDPWNAWGLFHHVLRWFVNVLRRQGRYGRRNAVRSLLDRFFGGYAYLRIEPPGFSSTIIR